MTVSERISKAVVEALQKEGFEGNFILIYALEGKGVDTGVLATVERPTMRSILLEIAEDPGDETEVFDVEDWHRPSH